MYCEFLLNLSTTSIDLCVDRNLSGDLELDIFDPIFQISFLVSVSIGISIRFLTHRTTAPPQKIMAIFQLGAFLMSMIWLYILCEVIVELLENIGGNLKNYQKNLIGTLWNDNSIAIDFTWSHSAHLG